MKRETNIAKGNKRAGLTERLVNWQGEGRIGSPGAGETKQKVGPAPKEGGSGTNDLIPRDLENSSQIQGSVNIHGPI